jgi:hypothetical protein
MGEYGDGVMGRSKIRQRDAGIEGCGDNETFKNAELGENTKLIAES